MSTPPVSRLLDDQSARWDRGDRPSIEGYLRRYPSLRSDREAVLDLIYNEVVLRSRRGDRPTVEEYVTRFPELADALRAQFEVHAALEVSGEGTAAPTTALAPPGGAEASLAGLGPGATLGRHVLLEKLGAGGMGAVYKARHTALDRIDAVKVIRPELLHNPQVRERFYQEARAAAMLNHPNVVAVYDAGEDQGRHYLVLEYLLGQDLAALLRRRGRLSWSAVCGLLYQVALGLGHVHERGLVHRDLKPSNLLLASGTRVVKILDLGLACLRAGPQPTGRRLTQIDQVLGTPDYMAPEQVTGLRTVDIRADLYSLGCSAYHLLAGRVPFPGGDLFDKLRRHRDTEPDPLGQVRDDLPAAVVALVARLMAKAPADRFQTPAELAHALRDLLRDAAPAAPAAPPPPAPAVAPRPSRRKLLAAGGVGIAGAGLLGGWALVGWLSRRPVPLAAPPPTPDRWAVGDHLRPEAGAVYDLAFSPDGRFLAAACADHDVPDRPGTVRLYDLARREWATLGRHPRSVAAVRFAPGGLLVSGTGTRSLGRSLPGEVTLWEVAQGQARRTVPLFPHDVRGLALAPGGAALLAVDACGKLCRLDLGTGQVQRLRPGTDGAQFSSDPAVSADGRLLACATAKGRVVLCDAATGEDRGRVEVGAGYVCGVALLPGGVEGVAATGGNGNRGLKVVVWDVATRRVTAALEAGDAPLLDLALAADGRTLAVGTEDGFVQVWDVQTRERRQAQAAHDGLVWSVAFAPDGGTLASGGHDGTVRLWHPAG